MHARMKPIAPIALVLAALVPARGVDEALPKAGTVVDRFIEVTGGRAVYEKATSEVSTGTIEIADKGIKGTFTTYKQAPDKMLMVMELPGIGKLEEGTDGRVAWSRNPMQDARIKEGDEKALALRMAIFAGELNWRDLYTQADLQGVEDVDGRPCYKIVLTPAEGPLQTHYYAKDTNLLTRMTMTVKTQVGDMLVDTSVGDYRDESGMLTPHKIRQKVMGQELLVTIEKVQLNAPIDKARLELPDEVKALLEK